MDSHQRLAPLGSVPVATGRLDSHVDVLRLCRQARALAAQFGLEDASIRGFSAAALEAGRLLRENGADGGVELTVGDGPSVHLIFRPVTAVEVLHALPAVLAPFSDVVRHLSITSGDDVSRLRVAISARGLTKPGSSVLLNGPDAAVAPASLLGLRTPPALADPARDSTPDVEACRDELQEEMEDAHRTVVALYGELAELIRTERAERRALEDELRRRADNRAAANRAIEEFLSTLSHELRTPLNAMLGWARLLRIGHLDRAGAERALDALERNAQVQAQLISDILDASRIVTGNLQLDRAAVRLGAVIDAAIESIRPDADVKQITLDAVIRFRGRVDGDPDRLEQVVRNLLTNAIKFTPAGGRVRVSLERRLREAVMTVSDTGEGIDQAFLPFVFERFRQGDTSVTRSHGGLGLGLSIVRHIVELHGGRVTVASDGRGHGASFTVRLPVSKRGKPEPPST